MFEWLNSFSSRSWPTFTTEQPCCKHPLKESTLSWWQRVVFFPWQEIKGEGRGDPKSAKHLHCGELVLWPSIRCEGVGEARSKKKKMHGSSSVSTRWHVVKAIKPWQSWQPEATPKTAHVSLCHLHQQLCMFGHLADLFWALFLREDVLITS